MIRCVLGASPCRHRRFFPVVRQILLLQAAVSLVLPMVILPWLGFEAAGSSALGALVGFIPSLAFASRVGRREDRRTARQVVRSLYGGEALKLGLTGMLFAGVLQIPGIRILPLMAGYVAVLTVFWFALLIRGPLSEDN